VIALLMLAAAAAPTALQAESAFEQDAQKVGQWTAFRKWAAADAVMFMPKPIAAQAFLKDRKDPPQSLRWSASNSFVSCDGTVAVNTGPWSGFNGTKHGYFTTVWRREDGAWQWIYDAGDKLPAPRVAEEGRQKVASCEGTPSTLAEAPPAEEASAASGASEDGTLRWSWIYMPDGARSFRAFLWNGSAYEQVIADDVAAAS